MKSRPSTSGIGPEVVQRHVKRAVEVAAAGGHNILILGYISRAWLCPLIEPTILPESGVQPLVALRPQLLSHSLSVMIDALRANLVTLHLHEGCRAQE